jgi:hypothetical protein
MGILSYYRVKSQLMGSMCKNSLISRFHRAILFLKIKVVSEIIIQLGQLLELVYFSQYLTKLIGAFGEVRKCSNRKTGAIRAVKIIRKDSLDAKEKARFF